MVYSFIRLYAIYLCNKTTLVPCTFIQTKKITIKIMQLLKIRPVFRVGNITVILFCG